MQLSDCVSKHRCDEGSAEINRDSVKEIRGLKCPNHEYVRDNYHFTYQPAYPGAKPLSSTRCIKCGYTMSLHKVQK